MNTHTLYHPLLAATLILSGTLFAGEATKQITPVEPEADHWKYALCVPGWIAGYEGLVGLNGNNATVSINPSDLIRHTDMGASVRSEVSKGRFGITEDFLYTSISDGVGTNGAIKKLNIQFSETIGDLGLRWRLLEGPRSYLDARAGVRYIDFYQRAETEPNDQQINRVPATD